jgi:hypothetical protein
MEVLPPKIEKLEIQPVEGGHMFYDKCIVNNFDANPIFLKAFDPSMFTNPEAAAHTLSHLQREGSVYNALRANGFSYLPDEVHYDTSQDILYMTALKPEDGWNWEIPNTEQLQDDYVTDVLQSLKQLEKVPASVLPQSNRQDSLDEVFSQGWLKLLKPGMPEKVLSRLDEFKPSFYPHVSKGVENIQEILNGDLHPYLEQVYEHLAQPRPVVGHFDARQSNIAWHPDYGTKIIDWSWASKAPVGCDRTMFVIDLYKYGYDVSHLVANNLNASHALLQMGHWMARSTNLAPKGDDYVRFQQLASAVSAATLLL